MPGIYENSAHNRASESFSAAISTTDGAAGKIHDEVHKLLKAQSRELQQPKAANRTSVPEVRELLAPANSSSSTKSAGNHKPAVQHAKKTQTDDVTELSARYRKSEVPAQYQNKLIAGALRLAGHSATTSDLRYARALISQESSFNAGLTNLWDSNALAGRPSKGWAQVIDSTFKQFHAPGHNDIWNPVDNLAAGIRYADATYGYHDRAHNGLRWVAIHRSMRHLGY